ncbi:hypothetical protein HD806DRAFT_494700 [Xylariaceae sp. AK1471]|nr:hypothetical protein HD806DRAFT_494700 [Xylariaceae sp. AK1471]
MALDSPITNPSLLLSMPAEIRNTIYELVVQSEWGSNSQDFFVLDRPLPALFRTNKQVRSEALDVFLLKNHFHVYTSRIGLKWLRILGKDVDRFRFLILFIDINLDSWTRYVKALLPLVSLNLELRIRRAAASLSDHMLENFLSTVGLNSRYRWHKERNGDDEIIFTQVHFKKV